MIATSQYGVTVAEELFKVPRSWTQTKKACRGKHVNVQSCIVYQTVPVQYHFSDFSQHLGPSVCRVRTGP